MINSKLVGALIGGVAIACAVSSDAEAANCSAYPYPYTLANGSSADANQVMGNFNAILACANTSLAPLANPLFTGNVGIGVSNPQATLTVAGAIAGRTTSGYPGTGAGYYALITNNTDSDDGGLTVQYLSGGVLTNGLVLQGGALSVAGTVFGRTASGYPNTNTGYYSLTTNNTDALNGGLTIQYLSAGVLTNGVSLIQNGNVGIGTTAPSLRLMVNGSAGGTSSWQVVSDVRLKNDVKPLAGALNRVQQLRGVSFTWKPANEREVGKDLKLPANERQLGFIAQEVAAVVPEAVVAPAKGSTAPYALKEADLIPLLVEAIKELRAEVEQLRAKQSMIGSPSQN